MDKERMIQLAEHLERIPEKAFNMSYWYQGGGKGELDLLEANKNDFKCGMAACVGGHAAIVFPELLQAKNGDIFLRDPDSEDDWDSGQMGCAAIRQVLGLCRQHAYDLTDAYAPHQTKEEAAQFIRHLVERDPDCCKLYPSIKLPM